MDNPALFMVFAVLVLIAFVVIVVAIKKRRERERTEQFAESARKLGWSFSPGVVENWPVDTNNVNLFQEGHSREIRNFMSGEINGVKTSLFDYEFTTGSGKHASQTSQSVICIENNALNLPNFSLRPENYWHKLISMVGYQDIDIANREAFSNMFLLRGENEAAVRGLFTPDLLSFYETNAGMCTDGGGSRVFFFFKNHKIPPHEAQQFAEWGRHLYDLFARRSY